MTNQKINGNDLLAIGYEGKAIGETLQILQTAYKGKTKAHLLELLQRVLETPALYKNHAVLAPLAEVLLIPKPAEPLPLKEENPSYSIWGAEGIEAGARNQMDIAMRLPVTIAGALMPDAHQGYGLPIGGVLATQNAVIPYGVGVDIGCRMTMSLYDLPAHFLEKKRDGLKQLLIDNTRFGRATFEKPREHAVIDRPEFKEIPIMKSLKDRAFQQLGSSGGGNHFVEWGTVELHDANNEWGLETGTYLALLSHSGSRGLGATIAGHYTKLAMETCKLPQEAKHLAWLDLDSEAGQEYWQAMNLAGDYASACHHQIHERLAEALAEQPLAIIENHHNFAWKEKDVEGKDIIVHRKGATPAGRGVLGIIPGSMTAPGFIVRGKGLPASINSASHGAGRTMSRTKAKETISPEAVQQQLAQAGVDLIGSGLDEAPGAYKDIRKVMEYQQDLVEVVGTFSPKIVRMCGDEKFMEVD
ncbi:RtcB family protein [Cesiribacter sp. SM1]|uniref:RtcB family protein n=1 Tax=Cesiribacter sp. SM1 TaxID=2861196 RepID=UPI001CD3FF4E|nr:RtcB family protein [Cesiribacter sp. SM1]